jgi:hypothetical protein
MFIAVMGIGERAALCWNVGFCGDPEKRDALNNVSLPLEPPFLISRGRPETAFTMNEVSSPENVEKTVRI